MKDPEWMRDKLQVMAIEADDMLGSCDMVEDDYRDFVEVARNYMANAAEVIARLMVELEQVKRERDALKAELKNIAKVQDVCTACRHYSSEPNCEFECEECRHRCMCYECTKGDRFEWRGVQEAAEDA